MLRRTAGLLHRAKDCPIFITRRAAVSALRSSPKMTAKSESSSGLADIEDVDGAAAQAGPLASTKQGGTKRKRAPAKKKDTAPAVLTAFDADIAESMRGDLMTWFDVNHRNLPWRYIKGSQKQGEEQQEDLSAVPTQVFAYRVWISEVMLQQTQVATVIDYFVKWIAKWPTVQDLAAATQEEVNEVWAGLGYYRRASFLLKGAQFIVTSLDGVLPSTAAELLKIPGIGPYTSAAVASIAFEQPAAAVDGNVMRVMSRLLRIAGTNKDRAFLQAVDQAAGSILHRERPGDWNQAVMELGATVCKPKPTCSTCVLRDMCQARQAHLADPSAVAVEDWPAKAASTKKRDEHVAVCVTRIQHPRVTQPDAAPAPRASAGKRSDTAVAAKGAALQQTSVLITRRPETGLLAGLWEFPNDVVAAKSRKGEKEAAVDAKLAAIFPEQSGAWLGGRPRHFGSLVHVFSHINMTLHVFARDVDVTAAAYADLQRLCDASPELRVVPLAAVKDCGISTGMLKVLAATKNKLSL